MSSVGWEPADHPRAPADANHSTNKDPRRDLVDSYYWVAVGIDFGEACRLVRPLFSTKRHLRAITMRGTAPRPSTRQPYKNLPRSSRVQKMTNPWWWSSIFSYAP